MSDFVCRFAVLATGTTSFTVPGFDKVDRAPIPNVIFQPS